MQLSRFKLFSKAVFLVHALVIGSAAYAQTNNAQTNIAQVNKAQPTIAIVLNSRDANLSVIDLAANPWNAAKLQNTKSQPVVKVGKEPHHLYAAPDGKHIWVANAQSDELTMHDANTGVLVKRTKGIPDPYHIGLSPDNKWLVVNSLRLDRVDIYSHNNNEFKLVKRIPTGRMPSHLEYSADSKTVYITEQGSDTLSAISLETQSLIWTMPVGSAPAGVWRSPEGLLFVGIMGENYVNVIDPAKRASIKKIITGKGAHAFRGAGDGKILFVSNRDQGSISALNMQTLERLYDIPVAGGPDCMEVSADGATLWVTTRWARKLTVIDIAKRSIIQQYAVGASPHGIFLNARAPMR